MRIAIIGAQNVGKTRLVKSFLSKWPMYSLPDRSYRDIVKEKGLTVNKEGTEENQRVIRDALSDQALENADKKHVIYDRCILDNLVYSMWLYDKGRISNDDFMKESFAIAKTVLPFMDIIFYIPLDSRSPISLEERDLRETDVIYQKEIDNLFRSIQASYKAHDGYVFPKQNSPALIEIWGDEDDGAKTDMIAEYIDRNTGDLVEAEKNLMQTLEDYWMEKDLIDQVSK